MRIATLVLAAGLAGGLAAGCIHYSVHSSSTRTSSGWDSGGGEGSPYEASQPERAPDVWAPRPNDTSLAWDPSLGLYRVGSEPGTWFDGYAYYRKGPDGWLARRDPAAPWQPVGPEAVPPVLRGF